MHKNHLKKIACCFFRDVVFQLHISSLWKNILKRRKNIIIYIFSRTGSWMHFTNSAIVCYAQKEKNPQQLFWSRKLRSFPIILYYSLFEILFLIVRECISKPKEVLNFYFQVQKNSYAERKSFYITESKSVDSEFL